MEDHTSLLFSTQSTACDEEQCIQPRVCRTNRSFKWAAFPAALILAAICIITARMGGLTIGRVTSQLITLDANGPAAKGAFVVEDDSTAFDAPMKKLRNTLTGEYVEIFLQGGKIGHLFLHNPKTDTLRDVLLSYNTSEQVMDGDGLGQYAKGAILIPWPNRIDNGTYDFANKTYALKTNMKEKVGHTAIHGYLFAHELKVLSENTDSNAASLTLQHNFDGSDPGYPFPLTINLIYSLDAKGFTITTNASNRDKSKALPFGMGWHPYIAVPDVSKAIVTLDSCSAWNKILVNESNMIPTGLTEPFDGFKGKERIGGNTTVPTFWDNGFKAVTACEEKMTVRVSDDMLGTVVVWGDQNFPWWQVFSGVVTGLNEQAIAIEPMSSETNALNSGNGQPDLQAGESWVGSMGIYLRK